MTHLIIVSNSDDAELDAIRGRIGVFEPAAGLDDLVAALRRCVERNSAVEMLDAIGHSRAPGMLVLGRWVIDDSAQTVASFRELLRPLLLQLGVRVIRLLGCSTASTEPARRTLRSIARVTKCRVFGTKRYVSIHDYAPEGFISNDALIGTCGVRAEMISFGDTANTEL